MSWAWHSSAPACISSFFLLKASIKCLSDTCFSVVSFAFLGCARIKFSNSNSSAVNSLLLSASMISRFSSGWLKISICSDCLKCYENGFQNFCCLRGNLFVIALPMSTVWLVIEIFKHLSCELIVKISLTCILSVFWLIKRFYLCGYGRTASWIGS